MNNMRDNETTITVSDDVREWLTLEYACQHCKKEFMAVDALFCPYCGREITRYEKLYDGCNPSEDYIPENMYRGKFCEVCPNIGYCENEKRGNKGDWKKLIEADNEMWEKLHKVKESTDE